MANQHESRKDSKMNSKKKWLALTAVGVALLLIPRRSSRKASGDQSKQVNSKVENPNQ
ncbi:hypothetical protein [Psychrobacter sp. M13]|uniref:hypothetical protein n=1 Tax=Psychrobacter sp. M13 TaxID=3067275 RepID=UPI00273C70DD|nr:hypothetical protein [Psychrobacter sp. M13]WLP93965.1 hypothetical protein Q9G97_10280 [Psychrobacter sp. M13]